MAHNRLSAKQSQEAALDAFIEQTARARALIAQLSELADNHFDVSPDNVTWGDSESLKYMNSRMQEALDFITGNTE